MLNLVEKVLGVRCNNLFRTLNSYINRVFEIETVDKVRTGSKVLSAGPLVRKNAILDEHRFLLDLVDQEIPVVAPLVLPNGETIAESEQAAFQYFP